MTRTNRFGQPVGDDLDGWQVPDFPAERLAGASVSFEPLTGRDHAPGLHETYALGGDDLWTYMSPSRSAAKRLGFTYEGTFRQATHYKGRNRDTAWFAIIDTDWPALRSAFAQWLDSDNFDADGRQRRRLDDIRAER